jgi:hypothetical protein
MADYSNVFDSEITAAVNAIVEQYTEKKLSDKEYPLALLNCYGIIFASQLKRIADRLDDHNSGMDAIKGIRHELEQIKECQRSGVEGLSHIYETLVQIEMNSRK